MRNGISKQFRTSRRSAVTWSYFLVIAANILCILLAGGITRKAPYITRDISTRKLNPAKAALFGMTDRSRHSLLTIATVVIIFTSFGNGLAAQPEMVPKSITANVGTTARFNCTAKHNEPVYWTTKPYGSSVKYDIYMYIGRKYLLEGYGTSGRFSVEIDFTLKRYDLVIKDVRQSDGGVYTCVDERGLGKKAHAELIVWDKFECQTDQQQESYMGENVFSLDQDAIGFTCRMNYMGNIRPQFVWSVGERKLNGTQGTELQIASSSLILVATSKLDAVKVICEVNDAGALWTSDTIRVKYAVLKKEGVKECPGVEYSLDCSPSCSYKLETVNGTQRCTVSYSTGSDVELLYFFQSSIHYFDIELSYLFAKIAVLASVFCAAVITQAIICLCLIKKLRREKKNFIMQNKLMKKNEMQPSTGQNA